jgi:asparagine synthase (glutamine-hydrolysing)
MGFGVPLGDWLRGPLRERMEDCLAAADLEDLGIDPEPVRRLWVEFNAGRTHRSSVLWQMFVLVAWSRHSRTASAPIERAVMP